MKIDGTLARNIGSKENSLENGDFEATKPSQSKGRV